MIDHEKVITGLGDIKTAIFSAICFGDGYGNEHYLNTLDDAIELLEADQTYLQEQEKKIKQLHLLLNNELSVNRRLCEAEEAQAKPSVDVDTYVCAKCGHRLEHQSLLGDNVLLDERYNYCPACGTKVNWDD